MKGSDVNQEIDRLFDEAADLSLPQQQELLREVERRRPALLQRLEALLDADREGDAFLRRPVARLGLPAQESCNRWGRGDSEVPRDVGPYQVLRPLGQGGMGEVYLAKRREEGFQRLVALKVIRSGLDSPAMRARFQRERSALSRLEHPGIARLYGGEMPESGSPYLVMERVEGKPLDAYCRDKALSGEQRIHLFLEICDAVTYAHRNLVVHRDIKPSNVLVTDDGRPVLLDFGIAKLMRGAGDEADPDEEVTRTEHRPMSLYFASPEQVRGEAITTGTDIYSMGVLLYLLLSGCHPYRRKASLLLDLEQAIVERPPRKLSDARPSAEGAARSAAIAKRLAKDLDTILLHCLQKRPEERYESVAALAEDLRRSLSDRPVLARPEPWLGRARKFGRRHAWGMAATFVVTSLTLIFLVTLTLQNERIRQQRDFSEEERAKATTTLDLLTEVLQEPDALGDFPHRPTARGVLARQHEGGGDEETARVATRLVAIGRAHGSLEDWQKAAEAAQQALEIRRRLHGEVHLLTAECLHDSGRYLAQVDQRDLAIERLQRALGIRRQLLPEEHIAVATSEGELGRLLFQEARLSEAKTLLESALRGQLRHNGAGHPKVAEARYHLANLLRAEGSFRSAEKEFEQIFSIRRRALGKEHPRTLASLNDLALTRSDRGAFAAAIHDLREILEAQMRTAGPEHRRTLIIQLNLARALWRHGAFDEADGQVREALRTLRREVPGAWQARRASLAQLGWIALARGLPKQGERRFREALRLVRSHLGPEHWRVALALTEIAEALRQQGRASEAEEALRQARALKVALYGEDDAGVLVVDRFLNRLVFELGDLDAAERTLRQIRDAYRRSGVSASRAALDDLALGHVLLVRGELGAAEPLIDGAVETLQHELYDSDPRRLWGEILHLAHRALASPGSSPVLPIEVRQRRLQVLQGPMAFEPQQARILLEVVSNGSSWEMDRNRSATERAHHAVPSPSF